MGSKLVNMEESDFLDELKNVSWAFYYYRMENYEATAHHSYPSPAHEFFKNQVSNRIPIKGMDIGQVKHYKYSYLKECAGGLINDNLIQATVTGRLFRAIVEGRQVTIKKWDIFFPFRRSYFLYPTRLHNELMAFRNPAFTTHRNLPNLIGFSCEEVLAVVYDCRPIKSIHDEITSDSFKLSDRMNVATEIGNLIQFIHSEGKTVGSINAKNMGIDKDGVVKLFELGLNVGEDNSTNTPLLFHETKWNHYLFRSYGIVAPGFSDLSLILKADIYAYGILLLELMSKKTFSWEEHNDNVVTVREVFSEGQSLVEKSLEAPKGIVSTLSTMIIKCLDLDPLKRPNISDCLELLCSLKIEG